MTENIKTYRAVLSGRVQGVGFRFYVESAAERYNIKGYVKNTIEGRVETVCQGREKDLKIFMDKIKNGPSLSYVNEVKIEEINDSREYSIFEIKY